METKRCFWCGHEFPVGELSNRGNCYDCALERMRRWNELSREAHRTFRQEEIDRAIRGVGHDHLDRLWEGEKEDKP